MSSFPAVHRPLEELAKRFAKAHQFLAGSSSKISGAGISLTIFYYVFYEIFAVAENREFTIVDGNLK